MVAQSIVLLTLRAHYSIDLIAGFFLGHYFFIMSERYSYLIDWYVFGIPLEKRLALAKSEAAADSSGLNSQWPLSNQNASPAGGIGNYFLSCKSCQRPYGTYMVNENHVVYVDHDGLDDLGRAED